MSNVQDLDLDHEDDDRHNDVCMCVGSKHLLIDLLITQSNLSTTHCTTKSFPTSKGVEIVKQIEINPHPSSLNALDQEGVHGSPSDKSCCQYIAHVVVKSQLHRTVLYKYGSSLKRSFIFLDVHQSSYGTCDIRNGGLPWAARDLEESLDHIGEEEEREKSHFLPSCHICF